MKMRFVALTLALCATAAMALSAQGARGQAPTAAAGGHAKVLASVQGAWTMTTSQGQDMAAAGQTIVVTITDEKYVQTVNGQVVERGTFKFDETKKPMTLDLIITEGDSAGKTQLGVFDVTDKTMTGKLGEPGTPNRPTSFAIEEGFFTFVMVKK